MINVLRKTKKLTSGFTLIEMFIVIAVIGILAGVVFQGTAAIQRSARDTRRISDMRAIQNYLETYMMMCGHYPGTYTTADGCRTDSISDINVLKTHLDAAGIVTSDNFPEDPVRNEFYGYSSTDSNTTYVLGVQLELDNRAVREGHQETVLPGGFPACGTDRMYCVSN